MILTESLSIAKWLPLFYLVLYVLLISHFITLFFHGIAIFEIEQLKELRTWIAIRNLENSHWLSRYAEG
jgi:hypothetical protein